MNHKTKAAAKRALGAAHLPAAIIVLVVLWDWIVRLNWGGWNENEDISIFMSTSRWLVDGVLNWTREFHDNKLLVVQFLFYPAALFNSYNVWYLTSMGACLGGACAVYAITRDVFSPPRGYAPATGHYAGLYGGVFTLYLFSASHHPHHINALGVSMVLVSAVLAKRYIRRRQAGGKGGAALFALACFCATVGVGVRPYLSVFAALIPVWVLVAARLGRGAMGYAAVARLFLLWNACVALFFLCVNVLPFVAVGEPGAFADGVAILRQRIAPHGLEWTWSTLNYVFGMMDALSTSLFYLWAAFLALFFLGLAGGFYHRVVAFELSVLTVIGPLSVLAMTLAKNFWYHYIQMFLPFAAIGAVSFFVLLRGENSRYFGVLLRHKWLAVLACIFFLSGQTSELKTRFADSEVAPMAENLKRLLENHGLEKDDFLAPYNQYVHVAFNRHRHGFPNVSISVDATVKEWYQNVKVPKRYRIPTNFRQYCPLLDESGPRLVVFFKHTTFWGARAVPNHLAHCRLRHYDFHDVSADASLPSDVAYYFIRKGSASPSE